MVPSSPHGPWSSGNTTSTSPSVRGTALGSCTTSSLALSCCAIATVAGYAIADAASGELRAGIDGFAAGALLVMLIDSMIPEASKESGRVAGLITTLGFAVATALSSLS